MEIIMNITIEKLGSTLVVKLDGELDQSCASSVRERIDNEIASGGISNLIMDFENVGFMDSSGIGVLVGRYKLIKAMDGKMLVIRTKPQVDKVLELSGIKSLIEFE